MKNKRSINALTKIGGLLILIFNFSMSAKAQCPGDVTSISIPTSIGCSFGTGGPLQWDGAQGGDINFATSEVTWTTTGRFRLKREFPQGCVGTPLYSPYYDIGPPAPSPSEVSQSTGCGNMLLNYTGSAYYTYWQTEINGVDETYRGSRAVTVAKTYYARTKGAACWGAARAITVAAVPDPPTGPTPIITFECLADGVNITLTTDNANDRWYTSEASTTPLSGSNSVTVSRSPSTLQARRQATGGCTFNTPYVIDYTIDLKCGRFKNSTKVIKPLQAVATVSPADQAIRNVKYFDGIGRDIQLVSIAGSPLGKDVVVPITYDVAGRQSVQYLPYVSSQNNGSFKSDAVNQQLNFYANGAGDKVTDDSHPYSVTIFESSPLSRPIKIGSPGAAWQPNATNNYASTDRTIKKGYEFNSADEVLRWAYTVPASPYENGIVNASTGTTPTYYSATQLYKTKTKDEHHHEILEYTDKLGRIVLKRVQVASNGAGETPPPINAENYASTYYVYDAYGNLVCVLPPEATKRIMQSPSDYFGKSDAEKNLFLQTWAFRYNYDGRKRMILKQVPGTQPIYLVYDKRDRLVMTQDGKQRALTNDEWTFTKYDALNRPVLTGILASNDGPATMQANANAATTLFETYTASGTIFGYSNNSFPSAPNTSQYLTVTYYDHYDNTNIAPSGYEPVNQGLTGEITGNQNTILNQVTGTRVKNLTTQSWLRTVNYYDNKYRLIHTVSDHPKGVVRTSNVYDFTGKVLASLRKYTVNSNNTTIKERFHYDHAGRLLVTLHSVNGAPEVAIAGNYYNELGQLVTKGLHDPSYLPIDPEIGQTGVVHDSEIIRTSYNPSETALIATTRVRLMAGVTVPANSVLRARIGYTPQEAQEVSAAPGNFKQMVDYDYNIRGWLTRINDPAVPGNDYFNMELKYNTPTANGGTAQFNGNISEAIWKSAGLDKQSYGYDYDVMNRILKGRYFNLATPLNNGRFNEEIGAGAPDYDLNGNILNLKRYGKINATSYGLMDNLTYTGYGANGNKLMDVNDAEDTHAEEGGFKEIDGVSGDDYAYDDNGNLTKDDNKGVIGIGYNHLNLPSQVTKSGTDYIVYTYDATGRKLMQQVHGSQAKTTDYIGELVFEDSVLQFITHSEGRVVMDGGVDYQYFLRDHLGNVRTTFSTLPASDTDQATNEPSNASKEISRFVRYNEVKRVTAALFDRTNGTGPGTSIRLNGGTNERYGLARSISVMPGDVINAEVYVKYVDSNSANWTQALVNLISAITANTGGIVVDGANLGNSTASFPHAGVLGSTGTTGTAPKVYLNWIVFDKDYVMQPESGYTRISEAARETGTDISHERLFNPIPITISKPGFVYIYFSNENNTTVDAFFDDFKVEHVKSEVVQLEDYYPFGLAFNSYSREDATSQDYRYNGKEVQTELDLGWLDFGRRMYQPELGRFMVHDRFTEKFFALSSYQFAANNPLSFIDINGDSIVAITRSGQNINIENSPAEEGGENFTNTITLESDVSMDDVSDYSAGIVNDAMIAVGDNSIGISSGTRTPEQQVEAMYYNLENGSSVAGEKQTYGPAGDKVIDTYAQAKSETKTEFTACDAQTTTPVNSPSQIKKKMLNTVNQEGPTNVSNHVGINRKAMNVFDIKPSTVSDPTKMHNTLIGDSRVKQVWSPVNKPKEKAIHVEIKQPK